MMNSFEREAWGRQVLRIVQQHAKTMAWRHPGIDADEYESFAVSWIVQYKFGEKIGHGKLRWAFGAWMSSRRCLAWQKQMPEDAAHIYVAHGVIEEPNVTVTIRRKRTPEEKRRYMRNWKREQSRNPEYREKRRFEEQARRDLLKRRKESAVYA